MTRQNQLIVVSALCLLCCAVAGFALLNSSSEMLLQTIGIAVLGLSGAGLVCAFLAIRQPPASVTVSVPVKASLGRFLDGLENLLTGDVKAAIPMPEHISQGERERLETSIASLRNLLQQNRHFKQQDTPSYRSTNVVATSASSGMNPQQGQEHSKHLEKLSLRLEQLASQLLAATSSNDENHDGTQDQLSALKLQARKLHDRSRVLGDNVDLLKDLAEQSGVLALNAAIQASRSGEDGLGIIADELQRVANRHGDASRLIEENLQQLTVDILDSNKIIDAGRQHLSQGQHESSQLRRHIGELARTCSALRQQQKSSVNKGGRA